MIVNNNFVFEIKGKTTGKEQDKIEGLLDRLLEFFELYDMFTGKNIYADMFYYIFLDSDIYPYVEVEAIMDIERKKIRRFKDACISFIKKVIEEFTEYKDLKKFL